VSAVRRGFSDFPKSDWHWPFCGSKQCLNHDSEACLLVTLMSIFSMRTEFWQWTGMLFNLFGVLLAVPAIAIVRVFVSSTAKELKAYGLI
jgi:hypothetical protein